jgi:UDP-glucuronate 4-epimerase
MKVLVTGVAGFIGMHTAEALLDQGHEVVGLDNLNAYYDVGLKRARLARLEGRTGFRFVERDIEDRPGMRTLFAAERPQRVVHLAAQVGVRYSLQDPEAYIDANVAGFLSVLEGCRQQAVEHLVYASSSSVYGGNTKLPFSVHDNVDHPLSLYAATKKADELMAHTYAHLYGLPVTGLRFFTVYGPWGRPDMSMFLFTKNIIEGKPIEVFNQGNHARDFTYIDDVVDGVVRALHRAAEANPDWSGEAPDPASSSAPYRLYNIGNHAPVRLLDYIACIEKAVGKTANKIMLPMQPGDVPATFADIGAIESDLGFEPKTPLQDGVERFVAWYRAYYGV